MNRLIILLLVVVVSMLYTQVDGTQQAMKLFLFSDSAMLPINYAYYLSVQAAFVIMAYLIWDAEIEYRKEVGLFLVLSIGDLLDYVLRNSDYFYIGTVKLSYDILQMVIFGFVICRTLWTRLI